MNASALKPYEAYEKSAREEYGVKADNVCVADLPAPFFRGVIATAPIPADSVVASIPLSATFSVLNADDTINELVGLLRMNKVVVEEEDVLALMLIRERYIKQEGSKWHAHIVHLPTAVDSPLFYTADEVEAFKGTNFHPICVALRNQVDDIYNRIRKVMEEHGAGVAFPLSVFTKKAFTWAIGMVHSRFVTLNVPPKQLKFLVPYFDMFNHSPSALVTHSYDKRTDSVQIVTLQGWNAGEQVCLNYGMFSNLHLLRLHGFIQPLPTKDEHFTMELFISKKAPAFDRKLKLLSTYPRFCEMPPPRLLEELRKQAETAGGDAAATAEFSKWKGFVGKLQMTDSAGGGVKITAELFEGVPHLGLLRALRIIHCPEANLAEQEAIMKERPDESVGITLEADVLQFLSDSLVKQAEEIGKREEAETKDVEHLKTVLATGTEAMASITSRIQAALEALGRATKAPEVEISVFDGAEEEASVSILASASSSKKSSKSKEKEKKHSKKGKSAEAAGPTVLPVIVDDGAASKGTGTSAADLAHRYRLQCASYFKAAERAILESHIKWISYDLEELKIIAEHHNKENAAAQEDTAAVST